LSFVSLSCRLGFLPVTVPIVRDVFESRPVRKKALIEGLLSFIPNQYHLVFPEYSRKYAFCSSFKSRLRPEPGFI
jgi:hypothetical protein